MNQLLKSEQTRVVVTASGIWFQWCGRHRAKLMESDPLVLPLPRAASLIQDLHHSLWKAPPTMRVGPWREPTLNSLQRAWTWALHQRFGREACYLALRVYGPSATLHQLFSVVARVPLLRQRQQERSHLLHALGFIPSGEWPALDSWKPVKNYMASMGMTADVWRWLNRQRTGAVARIDFHNPNHMAWLHIWCWLGRDIPSSLYDRSTGAMDGFGGMTNWVRRCVDHSGALIQAQRAHLKPAVAAQAQPLLSRWWQIARVLRLAIDHWSSVGTSSQRQWLIREEFPLVCDWLLGQESKSLHVAKHWKWEHVIRAQAIWHLSSDPLEQMTLPNTEWSSEIDEASLSQGIRAQALRSTRALVEESRRMHHCVPGYIERCLSGEVRLFHLRSETGKTEKATLEIRWQPHLRQWGMVQLKGPCNAEVSVRMKRASQELSQLYSKAFRQA